MKPSPAVEKRDLRTGSVVWDTYPTHEATVHTLGRSGNVDVAIIGAGITGALVAEAVTAAGFSTLIIDRRRPAKGSTAASTALIQFEIDTPLTHLADHIGFEAASRAWLRSFEAVQGLGQLIDKHAISCGYRPRNAIYLAGNVLQPGDLANEAKARVSIGLPSRYLGRRDLLAACGLAHDAAIYSGGAADLNPVQLTNDLLRIAVHRGAGLCAPVELTDIVASKSGVGLATSDGREIEAKTVVLATGYELVHGVPINGHRRSSTWAFATSPQPGVFRALGDSVIWEAADPYLYLRTTIDGRLVVGGEDEDIEDPDKRDELLGQKIAALQAKTRSLLPWLDVEAACSWAGTFGESTTGLPTIGPVPGMPNCYAVLGYGGNGITFGYLAAQLLLGYLRNEKDQDAGIFAFEH